MRGAISATKAIPIVFATGSDPVAAGFVPSLARPRGNVTGISVLSTELGPKRLELLHELLPGARKIALMVNPNNSAVTQDSIQRSQAAAHRRGLELVVVKAGNGVEIESAIASAVRQGADAINIGNDGYLTSRGRQIAFFALRHGLPTMSNTRENVASGVLMSYGASYPDAFQKVGVYAGRILKGEKPADLPVLQPTRFELFINLTTAKAVEKGVILRRDWRSVRTWNRLKP
jgi:putative ABC transport system substrate-binding protein